jgi:glycosyltransferase involved in cell wall biosynthesis
MLSNNITVCIFAWNEALRLRRCIDNFRGLFSIVVIDNASTDRTCEVAAEEGVPTVTVENHGFVETPRVMDAVLAHCETDYVLIASVSEYVPLTLLQLYAETANRGSHDVVRAYRQSITAGKPIPISGVPNADHPNQLRFFRKGSISYENNQLHGIGNITVPEERVLNVVMQSKYHFYQFRDYDCSHTEEVLCRYDDVLAKQRYEAGKRFSWSQAIYSSLKAFINCYIRFGSLRYGILGFIHSYYRWHMEFTLWLRIWEWENGFTRKDVLKMNNEFREKLEEELAIINKDRSLNNKTNTCKSLKT